MLTLGIDAYLGKKEKSGVEWYTYYLLREMKKTTPPDWRVFLYSIDDDDFTVDISGDWWQWKKLAWPPRRGWRQIRLSLEMITRSPDVLFVPGAMIPFIHPHSFRAKKYTATTIHDIGFLENPELYGPSDRKRQELSFKFAAHHAAKIFTPSEATRQAISRGHPERAKRVEGSHANVWPVQHLQEIPHFVRNDIVTVTPLGVNLETYKPLEDKSAASQVLSKYGIRAPYILYVGRIDKKKNLPTLIKAFSIFNKNDEGKDFTLILAGSHSFGADEVTNKIKELGLENKAKMLGFVPENDMPLIFAGADFFVFPSAYEGFGLPILQAMAVGLPVIASDISALREVGGDAAIFVDHKNADRFADAMIKLTSDNELRERLIRGGILRLQNFSWRECAELTWQGIVNLVQ